MMNRRTFLLAGGAAATAAATGTAVYAGGRARTPSQRAAQASAPKPSAITVEVRQGQLTDELVLHGQLQRAMTTDVPAPSAVEGAARLVATKVSRKVGDTITSGEALLEISGRPLLVLRGDFPAYRNLSSGDSGPDVKQLQEALHAHYKTPRTGVLDTRTENDLTRLFKRAGYGLVQSDTQAGGSVPTKRLVLAAGEVVFVPALPASISALPLRVGATAEGTIASLASGAWQVVVPLDDTAEQALNRGTEPPTISLGEGPAKDRRTAFLHVDVTPARDQTQESRKAHFSIDGDIQTDLGKDQQVRITKAHSPKDSLIVPVSALWTAANGTVSITVAKDGRERTVPVLVVLSVKGEAAITGDVAQGDHVIVSDHG